VEPEAAPKIIPKLINNLALGLQSWILTVLKPQVVKAETH
jgi:hypothetical protein